MKYYVSLIIFAILALISGYFDWSILHDYFAYADTRSIPFSNGAFANAFLFFLLFFIPIFILSIIGIINIVKKLKK